MWTAVWSIFYTLNGNFTVCKIFPQHFAMNKLQIEKDQTKNAAKDGFLQDISSQSNKFQQTILNSQKKLIYKFKK